MAKKKTAKKKPRTRVKLVSPVTKKVKGSTTKKVKKDTGILQRNTKDTTHKTSSNKKDKDQNKITRSKKKVARDGTKRGLNILPHIKANQWKPGQSGNPKGKKPGTIGLVAYLRKYLQEKCPGNKRKSRGDRLMEQMVMLAGTAYGANQLRQILDRIEGPVPTKLEGGEEPVRMCFNFVKAVAPADIPTPSDADEATT